MTSQRSKVQLATPTGKICDIRAVLTPKLGIENKSAGHYVENYILSAIIKAHLHKTKYLFFSNGFLHGAQVKQHKSWSKILFQIDFHLCFTKCDPYFLSLHQVITLPL